MEKPKPNFMASISRQLPRTNVTRRRALVAAHTKMLNSGPNGSVLSGNTTVRLSGIYPQFVDGYNLIAQRQAESSAATLVKNNALRTLRLLVKHFVGVFNMGVERGEYQAAERSYFGIAADDSNLPNLTTEAEVQELAQMIVTNDPVRVTAGGAPMANPSTAEVSTALGAYLPLAAAVSNSRDALDLAQETLEALAVEADGVIKKVWDEAETFFNEESAESQRENCREWGVVYVSIGATATITIDTVTGDGDGQPVANVSVKQSDTGVVKLTDSNGRVVFETTVSGEDIIFELDAPEFQKEILSLTYTEGATVYRKVYLRL